MEKIDSIFVTKIIFDKYIRFKRGKIYWCFIDHENAFLLLNRDAFMA